MEKISRLDRIKYPSFGECIYCRRKPPDCKLTDEHIVPFSLGGNAVIVDGSCIDCANITKKFEDHVARQTWGHMRVHMNEQTRRKKTRPKTLMAKIAMTGKNPEEMEFPVPDHPYFTPMPVWGMPGLLIGEQPTRSFKYQMAHVFDKIPENFGKTLGLKHGEVANIPYPKFDIDLEKFGRAIAKIAYCQMVANFGLDGFRKLVLPELILGTYPYVSYFVGCDIADPPPPIPDRKVKHAITIAVEKIGQMRLIVANVRLYASSGTDTHGPPIYHVVLGAPNLTKGSRV